MHANETDLTAAFSANAACALETALGGVCGSLWKPQAVTSSETSATWEAVSGPCGAVVAATLSEDWNAWHLRCSYVGPGRRDMFTCKVRTTEGVASVVRNTMDAAERMAVRLGRIAVA